MGKKVTLSDIAADSGLSISTVSRALAKSGKISTENEKIVFESAQRLGYPLSMVNTPLELRNSINIALVTFLYSGEFFSSLFAGFDKATSGTNANIRLLSVGNSNLTPIEIIAGLKKSNFDAAIIFLPDFMEQDYRNLLDTIPENFPIVSAAPIVNPVLDTVTFDHYRGGHLVASHFEDSGFKKAGIIIGPASKSEALLRKNGFTDYVQASNSMELVWEYKGDYSLDAGIRAYEDFKHSTEKPDAIFCSNDDVAIGFIHRAMRDGIYIPDDVAIAGFDDLPKCEYYIPSITSVHTPYELLGRKLIELLIERIKNPELTKHSGYTNLIPVTLSIRESSKKVVKPEESII